MPKASGAGALFRAGLLMAGFGTVGLVARPDPSPAFLLLTGVTAATDLAGFSGSVARSIGGPGGTD
ncbi:MAG: hypothetical protein IRY85_18815 [Micromonosporaceae bacterium]|nr:hypothetical protein [Micromonosporaceae bacterium]